MFGRRAVLERGIVTGPVRMFISLGRPVIFPPGDCRLQTRQADKIERRPMSKNGLWDVEPGLAFGAPTDCGLFGWLAGPRFGRISSWSPPVRSTCTEWTGRCSRRAYVVDLTSLANHFGLTPHTRWPFPHT